MLLEKKEQRKTLFRRLMVIFVVILFAFALCGITAAAEETSDEQPAFEDPERWGWPLDGVYDSIKTSLCELLNNIFQGSFGLIDKVVKDADAELGKTPANYDSTMFQTVEKVVNGVMIPIGSIVLVYVILYEFIQALIDKNSFHDFDTSIFIRFIFKSCLGIWFLSNCFTIVNALFDLGTYMVNGVTSSSGAAGTLSQAVNSFAQYLQPNKVSLSTLILIIIPAGFLNIVSLVIYACVYVILIGRMVEIYIHISVAPIPMATLTNRDFGDTGKNYLKVIFAYALQAVFIMIAIVLYANLCGSRLTAALTEASSFDAATLASEINNNILFCIALGIVLLLTMFKSGNVAKSILNCH